MTVPSLDPRTRTCGLSVDGVVHRPVQVGLDAWSPMCERMDAIDKMKFGDGTFDVQVAPSRSVSEDAFVPKVLTCLRCLVNTGGTW